MVYLRCDGGNGKATTHRPLDGVTLGLRELQSVLTGSLAEADLTRNCLQDGLVFEALGALFVEV